MASCVIICIKFLLVDLAVRWQDILGAVFSSGSRLPRLHALHVWKTGREEKGLSYHYCTYHPLLILSVA